MAMTKTLLKGAALNGLSPSEILSNVNNALEKDNDSCMFATVICGILNMTTGSLNYSNAGHNHPLICRAGKQFEYIKIPNGRALGPIPMTKNSLESIEEKLYPNDILFLYTDGITEAMNIDYEQFTEAELQKTLNSLENPKATELTKDIYSCVEKHANGAPQSDDITMLAIKFKGKDF